MNSCVIGISTIVTAIATAVIAVYSWQSHELGKKVGRANALKEETEAEFKKRVADLYQAIIIATLISGPNSVQEQTISSVSIEEAIKAFTKHYKGATQIFSQEVK